MTDHDDVGRLEESINQKGEQEESAKMSEYVGTMREKTAEIRDACYKIQGLARGFYVTGNTVMGETLETLARKLIAAQREINNSLNNEIKDRLNDSQKTRQNNS